MCYLTLKSTIIYSIKSIFLAQTSCFGGLPDVTEHSHGGSQHKITRRIVTDTATIRKDHLNDCEPSIVPHNPLVGCLSSTPHKTPLCPQQDPRQTAPFIQADPSDHQTILGSNEKLGSIEHKRDEHRSCIFGRSCVYVLLGALLAAFLLGSVGFFVSYLGFSDLSSGNHESFDHRVSIVKRLMQESPLIGKQEFVNRNFKWGSGFNVLAIS